MVSLQSGRKTVIQSLREDFHPLEISELTSHANPYSISSYSHNPLEKQRRMSNKLAGFSKSTTTTVKAAKACGSPRNNATAMATAMDNGSDGLTARALDGLFSNVSFNNSPVNISITLQTNSRMFIPAIQSMAVARSEVLQMKASEFLKF